MISLNTMFTLETLIIVGRRVPQNMASYISFVRCFNDILMELASFWKNSWHFHWISDMFNEINDIVTELVTFWRN